jgi:hypothetical protein
VGGTGPGEEGAGWAACGRGKKERKKETNGLLGRAVEWKKANWAGPCSDREREKKKA